jgi:citrate synthase
MKSPYVAFLAGVAALAGAAYAGLRWLANNMPDEETD